MKSKSDNAEGTRKHKTDKLGPWCRWLRPSFTYTNHFSIILYIFSGHYWYGFFLVQDHVCSVRSRCHHGNAPAGSTTPWSCISPVFSGNPGLHRHRPSSTNPGSASRWSASATRPSSASKLSITELSGTDSGHHRSSGKKRFAQYQISLQCRGVRKKVMIKMWKQLQNQSSCTCLSTRLLLKQTPDSSKWLSHLLKEFRVVTPSCLYSTSMTAFSNMLPSLNALEFILERKINNYSVWCTENKMHTVGFVAPVLDEFPPSLSAKSKSPQSLIPYLDVAVNFREREALF